MPFAAAVSTRIGSLNKWPVTTCPGWTVAAGLLVMAVITSTGDTGGREATAGSVSAAYEACGGPIVTGCIRIRDTHLRWALHHQRHGVVSSISISGPSPNGSSHSTVLWHSLGT